MDPRGKVVMESILETKASTILEFFAGLRGTLSVPFEEGTWAAWLYDLLKPHVELKNGRGLRLQDGFHNYFASGIHYRDRDGCLMHVEPNILFTVHQGAPFCRWSCER